MHDKKSIWLVEFHYRGRFDRAERFPTREDALAFYESRLGAMRFGLVGWTVSYPREVVS